MDMFATTQPEKRHEFKVSRMGMSFRELGAKHFDRLGTPYLSNLPVSLLQVLRSLCMRIRHVRR